MKYSADPNVCIVGRCRKPRRVFAGGDGRVSTRCDDHNRELRDARRRFDEAAGDLRRLRDRSFRTVAIERYEEALR
jgi:uncharacterized protein (DUF3084 family)